MASEEVIEELIDDLSNLNDDDSEPLEVEQHQQDLLLQQDVFPDFPDQPTDFPEPTMEYTNYDVLCDSNQLDVYELDDYADHVGNSRFNVLVEMYREAFELAVEKGQDEECQSIIDRIYEVQCHKSIATMANRGRFLLRVPKPGTGGEISASDEEWWMELNESEGKNVVRGALSRPPFEEEDLALGLPTSDEYDRKRGRTRSLLRRSASESTMMEDKKKTTRNATALAVPVSRAVASKDLANHRSGYSPKAILSSSAQRQLQLSLTAAGSNSSGGDGDDGDVENVSGSAAPASAEPASAAPVSTTTEKPEAAAKKEEPTKKEPEPKMVGSAAQPTIQKPTFVSTYEGLDVVFASNGKELSSKPGIVGNNRLTVMLTLQTRDFELKSKEEQEKVTTDLVKAVTSYWNGRVLIEHGITSFMLMTPEQAKNAMRNLLIPPKKPKPRRRSQVKIQPIPLNNIRNPYASNNGMGQQQVYSNMNHPNSYQLNYVPMKHPMTGAIQAATTDVLDNISAPRMNFMPTSSEQILKSGMNNPGAQTMQSNAILSLQQRKAKRGKSKSLGKELVGKTGVEDGSVKPQFVKLNNWGQEQEQQQQLQQQQQQHHHQQQQQQQQFP